MAYLIGLGFTEEALKDAQPLHSRRAVVTEEIREEVNLEAYLGRPGGLEELRERLRDRGCEGCSRHRDICPGHAPEEGILLESEALAELLLYAGAQAEVADRPGRSQRDDRGYLLIRIPGREKELKLAFWTGSRGRQP